MKQKKKLSAVCAWLMSLAMCISVICTLGTHTTSAATTYTIYATGTYGQTEARSILSMVNSFRTGSDAWYWNSSNSEKVYCNLSPLTYDDGLEQIAMQRAMEIAVSFSHTRPDGTSCFTATVDGSSYSSFGENIAAGYATAASVFQGWREDNDNYAGQGHRRNMLGSYGYIGIGHVVYNGTHYWVMELGYSPSGVTASVNDASTTKAIQVAPSMVSSVTLNSSPSPIKLGTGSSYTLPKASLNISLQDAWPGGSSSVTADCNWTVGDTTIATISNGKLQGIKVGTTQLTGEVFGKTVTTTVTVIDRTEVEQFCKRLYEKCLGRGVDTGGLNYWADILLSGQQSGASVAYGFVFSNEYTSKKTSDTDYIKMLYLTFMDRSADSSGLTYWTDLLNQGVSREYIFKGFVTSTEFTNICNSYGITRGTITCKQARDQNVNLTKFVNRIYAKAMGRSGEGDGLNYWCGQIQSKKMTPVQVAEYFIISEEFNKKNLNDTEYVKVLYRTFMGREYDQSGLNYWLNQLQHGKTRKQVLESFAGCPEFQQIMKQFGL